MISLEERTRIYTSNKRESLKDKSPPKNIPRKIGNLGRKIIKRYKKDMPTVSINEISSDSSSSLSNNNTPIIEENKKGSVKQQYFVLEESDETTAKKEEESCVPLDDLKEFLRNKSGVSLSGDQSKELMQTSKSSILAKFFV